MGKDREGVFRPKKGDEELAENVHVMHPNRNTQKKKSHQLTREEDREQAQAGVNDDRNNMPQIGQPQAQELSYRMNKEELVSLIKKCTGYCVSVYLPANDPSSFRNCLKEAEQQGESFGIQNMQRILAPGFALAKDDDFWGPSIKGLAFFATQGFAGHISLPEPPEQQVLVNDHFLLAPMIPYMMDDNHFFVLTLSKHQAKLFRGDKFDLEFVQVPGMPRGVEDVVHFEEKDEAGVFRTGGGGGTGGANFHGVGGGKPDEKESIALYFAEVARTVEKEALAQEHAPLLLAAVDYLHPIYVGASHYKPIVQEGLVGNFDQTSTQELHQQALEKMQPVFDAAIQRHLDDYYNKISGPLASQIPSDVIPAACFGQAGRLFIQQGAHIWGHFDPATQQLEIHDEQQPGDDCLINEAAMQVLLNGGYVHMLPQEKMPEGAVMAALFRYP